MMYFFDETDSLRQMRQFEWSTKWFGYFVGFNASMAVVSLCFGTWRTVAIQSAIALWMWWEFEQNYRQARRWRESVRYYRAVWRRTPR